LPGAVLDYREEMRMELQSAEIGKLAEALSKAQGAIEDAKKESENPFFKSNYADLSSVWKACRKHLSGNGLAVIQAVDLEGRLRTTLAHTSGEWIASVYPIKPVKDDPQGLGSAVTYARRYSLAAIVGIAPAGEDDDGEGAQGRPAETKAKSKKDAPKDEDGNMEVAKDVLAAALELAGGSSSAAAKIIEEASSFTGEGGKAVSFSDPYKVKSAKWLNGTLHKLRDKIASLELDSDKTPF
jgi:ERF superfamily